jgi:hypothetical protein
VKKNSKFKNQNEGILEGFTHRNEEKKKKEKCQISLFGFKCVPISIES